MLAYYGTAISDHITQKPNGGIICTDVPIARTGRQEYLARELQLDGDPERVVQVTREEGEVFSPAAMASFEGACVTDGHPPENVTAVNFGQYSKGHAQNVRRVGEFLVADLHIDDSVLADQVLNRAKREVSCGYLCSYAPSGGGYAQREIRGNHVAIVPRGRAGSSVSIKDSAQCAGKGRKYMGKFGQAILEALGMAAHEAENPQEVQALVATAASVLDAAPQAKEKPAGNTATGTAQDSDIAAVADKLDKVLAMLESLKPAEKPAEEAKPNGEDELDSLLEKLDGKEDGEKAVTVPADKAADACLSPAAKDAAVAMLRSMRPVVAAIKDEDVRARVTDALIASIRDQGKMNEIAAAAQASAKQAADQAAMTSYEKRCADSQTAYAARNPHKRQEKEV